MNGRNVAVAYEASHEPRTSEFGAGGDGFLRRCPFKEGSGIELPGNEAWTRAMKTSVRTVESEEAAILRRRGIAPARPCGAIEVGRR
ncbi:hypothetical protein C0Z18_23270 [Trinickia dabaoshanensis]|uniref:Uncharacterized protein n=1 Tax=Trinickia dabaoshanensis TaxID=564714 RepID=A0A2N7VH57_9BURK|nr:hypothetical protein C0Z18_23270 [Trinickia dabaoshanensis]